MISSSNESVIRIFFKYLPYNAVFCTVIAIFLTIVGFSPKGEETMFIRCFVYSQSVGSLCSFFVICVEYYLNPANLIIRSLSILSALIMGSFVGVFLGSVIQGIDPFFFLDEFAFFVKISLGTIIFGLVISYFWHSRDKMITAKTMAQEERIKRLSGEKEMIEMNLKLLQAQIEPHFLFNTLSNILSLLETDPQKGKSMLADLTHYLRTSLSKTRKDVSTVGQEIEMIRDYLKIFKVRMGDRLQYEIQIPDHLKNAPLQPMLVQPLVENAIRHGLEPKVGGGKILVRAHSNKDALFLEVADTGLGMQDGDSRGTGLDNIRERLRSLYGERGRLTFEENQPSGVKAIIEVPHESG